MLKVAETDRNRIAELCRRFQVVRLDLFGSAAEGTFDPQRSDIDLLVEFGPVVVGKYADVWFGLHDALEALFQRPVDLVSDSAIRNPYFRAAVERTRQPLYAA